MKYGLLLLLLAGGPSWGLLTWVRDRNTAVARGRAAYARGDGEQAAALFAKALAAHARKKPDPALVLDLAHAQVRAGQLDAARATYGRLLAGYTPKAVGSVARQQLALLASRRGETAQALSLLHQALLLDPGNGGARFDYEVLSEYLAQGPNTPTIPAPPKASKPSKEKGKPSAEKNGTAKNQPAEKAGTDHPGEINDPKEAVAPSTQSQSRPAPTGQPDNEQPNSLPGKAATGGSKPGTGAPQPVASGDTPGARRGLDRNTAAPGPAGPGNGKRPGAEHAAPADVQLQTQRERLHAMNLSPAQARQLLETMRAQEQQYLQQLTPAANKKPDPTKPTW